MHGIMRARSMPYFIAALFSILLSVAAALKTSVINPDAICYLYSAEALQNGLSFATHLCPQAKWPFYSILIAGTRYFTHLSLTASAFCLNGFFSLISVLSFMAIVDLLTKKRRIVLLAGAVILLAHTFNDLRVEIIRDHGFWAFYLLSIYFALRYFMPVRKKGSHALLWSSSLVLATLFRIEGVFFLILPPLGLFFDNRLNLRSRIACFLQLNSLAIAFGFVLFFWLLVHPDFSLGRLTEIRFQIQHGFSEWIHVFQQTAGALATHVLNAYSARDAVWILCSLFVVWYLISVASNVSLVYAVLIIYAFCKKLTGFSRETRLVLWTFILINILITMIFLMDNLFLAKRYLVALSLTLMLWVPFALNHLIDEWRKRKWPLLLAIFFMMIYGVGGIVDFGHSKQYIRDSGEWFAMHVTPAQKIYSNDYQVLYYSNHLGTRIFTEGTNDENLNTLSHEHWKQYDYIALHVSLEDVKKNIPALREMPSRPIVIFQNDRHDQVRIYEIHPRRKTQ